MSFREVRVLLIDDDEDDFINLRDIFSEIAGTKYNLTWKSTYGQGLEALRNKKFDVCLLDYRLGEHTGIDLLLEVQKLGQSCPIIFLTGQSDFELDVRAMQMGAAEFLVKAQLTPHLLERTLRYTMKHALDMKELRESRQQILQQDRMASIGLLASSLAHEIGTPLGIIRSRAELAARKADDASPLKQDMGIVVTQIDRITKLVNSLLNLAREKKSETASQVSVNAVVQDVLNLMQHELDRKGILFELDFKDGLHVMAEAGPLGQVLLNLLVNAVHAIDEAKAKGFEDGHKISLKVLDFKNCVEISVTDTGCGISKENMNQLFKPFFTTKGIGQGTGLGLATSYRLIQSWNGSISVESEPNHGATFKVKLLK